MGVLHGGFDEWVRRDLPTQAKTEELRLHPEAAPPEKSLRLNSSA